jgi:hypothetical protein
VLVRLWRPGVKTRLSLVHSYDRFLKVLNQDNKTGTIGDPQKLSDCQTLHLSVKHVDQTTTGVHHIKSGVWKGQIARIRTEESSYFGVALFS